MAWTAPRTWNVGEVVTKAIMDVYIKANQEYLKTKADAYDAHDVATTGVHGVGGDHIAQTSVTGIDFADHESRHLYNGNDRLSWGYREVVINWENDTLANMQVTVVTNGGGVVNPGGTGQVVLKTDDDVVGDARIDQQTEQNSSYNNAWAVTKDIYFRIDFAINNTDIAQDVFIGCRTTPGVALPNNAVEKFCGLIANATNWSVSNSDASGDTTSTNVTAQVTDNTRHVFEMLVTSGTNVVYTIDGGTPITHTTLLPTGFLEWSVLIDSDGSGGAGDDTFLTVGKLVLRSDI